MTQIQRHDRITMIYYITIQRCITANVSSGLLSNLTTYDRKRGFIIGLKTASWLITDEVCVTVGENQIDI